MAFSIEQTNLWKRTLAHRDNDEHEEARERLRVALISTRQNAAQLVSLIPGDCKELTVHDISHLDALWEMADLICGSDFELNPAEAFVFGAAVLIHDAGMSVASYPGGIKELSSTVEWRDTVYGTARRAGLTLTPELVASPPQGLLPEILFSVLRALHAKHAEELISVTWAIPGKKGESARLLDDSQLRTSYARSIGLIAHSHNWSIERIAQDLRRSVGAAPDLPTNWEVNEIKLACLLRCADAAHIDHRRAPTMLFGLLKPQSPSLEHWAFQTKLNKPTLTSGTLTYSSGESFGVEDAKAWWLCFDAVKMVNRELQDSNAVLQDNGLPTLAAKRVFGAEGASILARQIQVSGWKPVDAEIRVSNPIHLAQTLGGKNLYGGNISAPIRELLQNAVDAVRARRKREGRAAEWGKIRLLIEDVNDETWVHVDDNGIGMSERTLVGPLLDFGSSLWNSPSLREELTCH